MMLAALVLTAAPALADQAPPADPNEEGIPTLERLERLVERIKYQQARMKTMEADFVQRKESLVLLEPEESTGKLWYHAPDRARWDFSSPNDTVVLINQDQMLTWFKSLGTAEQVNIGKQADRVMEYLSASNSLETLQRYFSLRTAFPDDPDAPFRLELDPKFKRVAKRIAGMEVHLHRHGYYPVFLRYEEPDGDVTEITFSDVTVNEEIGDEQFQVELPEDVELKVIELSKKKR